MIPVGATKEEVEDMLGALSDFRASKMWVLLRAELLDRREGAANTLVYSDDVQEMSQMQGTCQTLDDLTTNTDDRTDLPGQMIADLKEWLADREAEEAAAKKSSTK